MWNINPTTLYLFPQQEPPATPNPHPCWVLTPVTLHLTTLGASTHISLGLYPSTTALNCLQARSTPHTSIQIHFSLAWLSSLIRFPHSCLLGRQQEQNGFKPQEPTAQWVVRHHDSASHHTQVVYFKAGLSWVFWVLA